MALGAPCALPAVRREHTDDGVVGERARARPRAHWGHWHGRAVHEPDPPPGLDSPSRSGPRPPTATMPALVAASILIPRARATLRSGCHIGAECRALEAALARRASAPADAFAEADAFLGRDQAHRWAGADRRPWWARRYWAERGTRRSRDESDPSGLLRSSDPILCRRSPMASRKIARATLRSSARPGPWVRWCCGCWPSGASRWVSCALASNRSAGNRARFAGREVEVHRAPERSKASTSPLRRDGLLSRRSWRPRSRSAAAS